MWEGKPKALTIDISEVVGECVCDKLADILDFEVDIDINDMDVKLQINVTAKGTWVIVGVNGYPIDYSKRLVNV